MRPLEQQTTAEIIREWALLNADSNPGADYIARLTPAEVGVIFGDLLAAKQWAARYNKRQRDKDALAGNRFGV